MAASEATIRATWASTVFRLVNDMVGTFEIKRAGSVLEVIPPATTSVADTLTVQLDPWESIFGRFNDDPSWEDFPRWLSEQYCTDAPHDPQA